MDTPPTDPRRWSQLTEAARQSPVPEIDVRREVLASIRSLSVEAPESLLGAVASLLSRVWLRPAMAVLAATATALGYGAYRTSDLVALMLGFSF